MNYVYNLMNCDGFRVLIIVIVLDIIFGILRAIREHSLNSCIGIDGMIRKFGMLVTIFFMYLIDSIVQINFIGFIPEEIRQAIKIENIGISELFNMLFIVFEILSIFKNMVLCKMPIPIKLQEFLEEVLKEFTGEIKK